MERRTLIIKICSYRSPQRYAVERSVRTALSLLRERYPEIQDQIVNIKDVEDILKYSQVLILPSLVINEKLVCSGRFPKKGEILKWLEETITE
jgi:hypothetical protein